MSRTRGSSNRFQDDGVMLGKGGVPLHPTSGAPIAHDGPTPLDRQGNPISPAAALIAPQRNIPGHVMVHGPGAEPVPTPLAIIGYRADMTSFARNMDGFEVAGLLNLAFANPGALGDGFIVELTPDQFMKLGGDLRRHFKAVRG